MEDARNETLAGSCGVAGRSVRVSENVQRRDLSSGQGRS